jgi:tRNA (adenine57-N1/adenine58-N1)-methyltransferase
VDPKLKDNDPVLFIDRKGRRYLKILRLGHKILIRGEIAPEDVIGIDEGSRVKSSNGEPFMVLRPTYADLIPNLPRAAQVIYPKDTGPLLIWGDVFPGATVIEGGTGAGALTIALLRAVGPQGHVISYEVRHDFANSARRNVGTFFGPAPNWTLRIQDLYEGFEETGVDRIFLDLPEPGRALGVAAKALRAGGVLVCYVPTTVQLQATCEELQRSKVFGEIESFETMQRYWQVKGMSVRPVHRMVAHSAFIIVSRRLSDSAAVSPQPQMIELEESGVIAGEASEQASESPDPDDEPDDAA